MGIRSMAKFKIGKKLFVTYFIILIVTFVITAFSFNLLSHRYLINEARMQLKKEGNTISEMLKNIPLKNTDIKQKLLTRRDLNIAGKLVESNIVVLNKDREIIYSNLRKNNNISLIKILRENRSSREYIIERKVITDNKDNAKGYLLLFTKIKDIKNLNILMRRAQFFSFIIAGFIAVIIGLYFGNSLIRPLMKLKISIKNFSIKSSKKVNIKTGDEIEEISECFNELTDKLKAYNDQQVQFLQNTSHELKTPLMSIQGYAEALKDGILDEDESKESFNIIISECQRLKKVVNEIIYLTKLESLQENYKFEDIKIEDAVLDAVKSVKSLADEKGITINFKSEISITAKLDKDKIKQAVINILGNCIRYADKTVDIIIAGRCSFVDIKIMDDGPGFEEGEEEKIFNRFYKGENGGSGIGLPIAKAIIDSHKGNINAFNNQNKRGAVFIITIPI